LVMRGLPMPGDDRPMRGNGGATVRE